MEAVSYIKNISHLEAFYEDSKEEFICVYLDNFSMYKILYGKSRIIKDLVIVPASKNSPEIKKYTYPTAFDTLLPKYVHINNNIMVIGDIHSGHVKEYTGRLFNDIDDLIMYNGNVYFSITAQKNILGLLANGKKLTYNGFRHYNDTKNIVMLNKIGGLNKYTHINLQNGVEKILFTTYGRLKFHYCDNNNAIYTETKHDGNGYRICKYNIKEKKSEYMPYNSINTFGGEILLTKHHNSGFYFNIEMNREIEITQNSIPFVRNKIYDIAYYGCLELYSIYKIGVDYYGLSHKGYPDNMFSKFGYCCICKKINPRDIVCDINDNPVNHNLHVYCSYTYRDYINILLHRLSLPKDIQSYIYPFLFGDIYKIERYKRYYHIMTTYNRGLKNGWMPYDVLEAAKNILNEKGFYELAKAIYDV
jgi:hypothetical protein